MKTLRTHITATPLYPGSFYPDEGTPVPLADTSPGTALRAVPDDDSWFAIEVYTATQKLWTDGEGGELWLTEVDRPHSSYRIYKGEKLSVSDVEALPGDNRILLANMRGNRWDAVVRTRRGNFQPLEDGDVVV